MISSTPNLRRTGRQWRWLTAAILTAGLWQEQHTEETSQISDRTASERGYMRMTRADALLVLNTVMAAAPQHVTGTYLLPALQHYVHLLAPSQRARSVKAGSMKSLSEVLLSIPCSDSS